MSFSGESDPESQHDTACSVIGWSENGVAAFAPGDVACDASCSHYDNDHDTVSGAAVSTIGEWWAWRAFTTVNQSYHGLASTWAEYLTLLKTLERVNAGVVHCDYLSAIEPTNGVLRSKSPRALSLPLMSGIQRIHEAFGALPRIVPSSSKRVTYASPYNRIHRRAHKIANIVRRAEYGYVEFGGTYVPVVPLCDLIAEGRYHDANDWANELRDREGKRRRYNDRSDSRPTTTETARRTERSRTCDQGHAGSTSAWDQPVRDEATS